MKNKRTKHTRYSMLSFSLLHSFFVTFSLSLSLFHSCFLFWNGFSSIVCHHSLSQFHYTVALAFLIHFRFSCVASSSAFLLVGSQTWAFVFESTHFLLSGFFPSLWLIQSTWILSENAFAIYFPIQTIDSTAHTKEEEEKIWREQHQLHQPQYEAEKNI